MSDWVQAAVDYAREAEREQLEYSYLVLVRREAEAHQAIDLLEPCPPKLTDDGKDYTVAGRLDWYREHMHEVWVRGESVLAELPVVPGIVEVRDWIEREMRP